MQGYITNKSRLVYVISFVFAFLLIMFAFRWQVIEAHRFTEEIADRKREYLIPSIRGPILASDGSTLAYSEPKFDLYAYVPEAQYAEYTGLQTRDEFYEKILPYSDYETVDQLTEVFRDHEKQRIVWFKIGEGLSLEQKNQANSLTREKDLGRLEGVSLEYSQERYYPEGTMAAHILGFADPTPEAGMVGRSGLESEWNGNLEPQKGYVVYDVDAAGNPVAGSTDVTIQAKRGSSVVTTIDKYLQGKLETHLQTGTEQFQSLSASGVIMDPKTGAILAMANYPTFDPNTRDVEDPNVFGNAAVSQPYEIGSVGKALTLAAAIDSDTYDPQDVVIEGHNGCEDLIEGFRVCNLFGRPAGQRTLESATVASDNVAYFHIAQAVGEELLYDYLTRFGVGYPSGVDISGESYGYIKPPERWNLNDLSAYSYGTSYQLNAVQAVTAIGAIANYGVKMQPRLVDKLIEADGKEILFEPQTVEQVISEDSSLVVNYVLNQVFESNLYEWIYKHELSGYPLGMKSGTGLIVKDGVYSTDYNATYVGYDQSPHRRFVMLIRLNSPQVGRISSENARIVWLDTFLDIRQYLGY